MTFTVPALTAIETLANTVETVVAYGTKVYAIGSEIFTVSAMLWVLNFLSNSIQKTYNAGLIVGKFYRRYLHSHVKSATLAIIAGVIFLSVLIFRGCEKAYHNRREIVAKLNDIRNAIGRQFAYN